jgi:multiple sugar transport system permease protein
VAEREMMAAMSDDTVGVAPVEVLPTRRRRFPIGLAARYAVLIGTILLTLFPLVWLVITSLRIPSDIFAVPVHIIPASITWRQYVNVFTQYNLAGYLWNTIVVSLATVVFVTVLAVPCAYAMARFRLPFHRVIVSLLLIMRMIPVVALAIPLFAVFANLGLLDTLTSLILAHTAAKLPVAIWLLIGFVQDVPKEIEESAAMDGAGTLRTLVQIVTPLIAPGLGASAVITFLFTWNDLLIALTLASSENAQTLPVGLTNFVSQYGVDWGAMSAAGVLMVIPTLIFVWFAQGLLVKGLVTGAVRG